MCCAPYLAGFSLQVKVEVQGKDVAKQVKTDASAQHTTPSQQSVLTRQTSYKVAMRTSSPVSILCDGDPA
jgi:hypothetical protein